MILRRLTTALREQDWFTVVIETLIVVFGVYLGLQLGNWNAERQQRADADRYLVQFSETLDETAEYLEAMTVFYNTLLNDGAVALEQLRGESLTTAEIENVHNVLEHVQQVRPLDPFGLGELSARLDRGEVLLEDRDLAKDIRKFRSSLTNAEEIVSHVTQRLNSYLVTMDKFSAIGPVLPEDRQNELFLEKDALEDPGFRIALAGALNMASYRVDNMTAMLANCRNLAAGIDETLQ